SGGRGKGLAQFLFEDQKGNCEFFATAAAVMLRHVGVPARFVAGFLAEEWNEYGRFYDVRQGSAHAWTEAYIGGRWVTLDATPPAGFSQAADAFYKRLERMMSALEMRWYQQVIGYDGYVQRNTFFRLSQAVSPERVLARAKRLALPGGLAAAAAACGLGLWRLRGRRRRAPRTLFERAQALLDDAGLPREAHLTPLEHARRLGRARPELAGLVPLVELHYLERYRGPALDAAQSRRAELLLADLGRALRR
ncbi:MAG: transglutaminase domain-containing protein, partial [Elusimicrobia bacterium]|nr:transglutaminase domain-containing protein [Elusimicrobiota bacterium]